MTHFQEGGYEVISRRKVLPPGEWTRSICRRLCTSSWSIIYSYLLFNRIIFTVTSG